jgi:hypothetical protein
MKILRVIVDKMPENCGVCSCSLFSIENDEIECPLLDFLTPLPHDTRHPDCPLTLADTLEAQNKRTANEVM